jgi:hypothetical protein
VLPLYWRRTFDEKDPATDRFLADVLSRRVRAPVEKYVDRLAPFFG